MNSYFFFPFSQSVTQLAKKISTQLTAKCEAKRHVLRFPFNHVSSNKTVWARKNYSTASFAVVRSALGVHVFSCQPTPSNFLYLFIIIIIIYLYPLAVKNTYNYYRWF